MKRTLMYEYSPSDYARLSRMMNFSRAISAEHARQEGESSSFILQSLLMPYAVKNVWRLNSQIVNVTRTKARNVGERIRSSCDSIPFINGLSADSIPCVFTIYSIITITRVLRKKNRFWCRNLKEVLHSTIVAGIIPSKNFKPPFNVQTFRSKALCVDNFRVRK